MKSNKTSFKKGQLKEKCINWKGGKANSEGYILIYCPEHPSCKTKKYVYEHRLVAEKILGRYLTPKEIIHHINKIKSDNRPKNLFLFIDRATHTAYHLLVKSKIIEPITKSNLKGLSNDLKFVSPELNKV